VLEIDNGLMKRIEMIKNIDFLLQAFHPTLGSTTELLPNLNRRGNTPHPHPMHDVTYLKGT